MTQIFLGNTSGGPQDAGAIHATGTTLAEFASSSLAESPFSSTASSELAFVSSPPAEFVVVCQSTPDLIGSALHPASITVSTATTLSFEGTNLQYGGFTAAGTGETAFEGRSVILASFESQGVSDASIAGKSNAIGGVSIAASSSVDITAGALSEAQVSSSGSSDATMQGSGVLHAVLTLSGETVVTMSSETSTTAQCVIAGSSACDFRLQEYSDFTVMSAASMSGYSNAIAGIEYSVLNMAATLFAGLSVANGVADIAAGAGIDFSSDTIKRTRAIAQGHTQAVWMGTKRHAAMYQILAQSLLQSMSHANKQSQFLISAVAAVTPQITFSDIRVSQRIFIISASNNIFLQ